MGLEANQAALEAKKAATHTLFYLARLEAEVPSSIMSEKKVISTIEYFTFFKYPPNFEEIYTFTPQKLSKRELQNRLSSLIARGKIFYDSKLRRYTPTQYQNISKTYNERVRNTQEKLEKVSNFIKFVSRLPQVKLLGFSGSVAMQNAQASDDIDFFVITRKNRMWTARFIPLILASLLGKRRKRAERHANDKICLNLFFEESALEVPKSKRTAFVAHEVLQMKPVIVRGNTYKLFLEANEWVFKLFPNAARSDTQIFDSMSVLVPAHHSSRKNLVSSLADIVETALKKLQLFLINRHKTSEIISEKQLWFFPEDFEKKIKSF